LFSQGARIVGCDDFAELSGGAKNSVLSFFRVFVTTFSIEFNEEYLKVIYFMFAASGTLFYAYA